MFKVSNRRHWRRSGVFIINFLSVVNFENVLVARDI